MKYGIWCKVSGGVTGTREAWMKDNGSRVECSTLAEAEKIAAKAMAGITKNGGVRFSYRAMPVG